MIRQHIFASFQCESGRSTLELVGGSSFFQHLQIVTIQTITTGDHRTAVLDEIVSLEDTRCERRIGHEDAACRGRRGSGRLFPLARPATHRAFLSILLLISVPVSSSLLTQFTNLAIQLFLETIKIRHLRTFK